MIVMDEIQTVKIRQSLLKPKRPKNKKAGKKSPMTIFSFDNDNDNDNDDQRKSKIKKKESNRMYPEKKKDDPNDMDVDNETDDEEESDDDESQNKDSENNENTNMEDLQEGEDTDEDLDEEAIEESDKVEEDKQAEEAQKEISWRRKTIETLVRSAREVSKSKNQGRQCRVLGLTATPVSNDLREVVSLLKLISGKELQQLQILCEKNPKHPSFQAKVHVHRALNAYGIRFLHEYGKFKVRMNVNGTTYSHDRQKKHRVTIQNIDGEQQGKPHLFDFTNDKKKENSNEDISIDLQDAIDATELYKEQILRNRGKALSTIQSGLIRTEAKKEVIYQICQESKKQNKPVIIYTHFVGGEGEKDNEREEEEIRNMNCNSMMTIEESRKSRTIVSLLKERLEQQDEEGHFLRVGTFLGKQNQSMTQSSSSSSVSSGNNGLQDFLDGKLDVLIGSRVLTTGIDHLQNKCATMIINLLPYTYAEWDQLKGRLVRLGQENEVTFHLPLTKIELPEGSQLQDGIDGMIVEKEKEKETEIETEIEMEMKEEASGKSKSKSNHNHDDIIIRNNNIDITSSSSTTTTTQNRNNNDTSCCLFSEDLHDWLRIQRKEAIADAAVDGNFYLERKGEKTTSDMLSAETCRRRVEEGLRNWERRLDKEGLQNTAVNLSDTAMNWELLEEDTDEEREREGPPKKKQKTTNRITGTSSSLRKTGCPPTSSRRTGYLPQSINRVNERLDSSFQMGLIDAKHYFEVNDRRDNEISILKKLHDDWYEQYDKAQGGTKKDAESFERFRRAPPDQVPPEQKHWIQKILSAMLDKKTQEKYYQYYFWYYTVTQHTRSPDRPDREYAVRKAKEKWLGEEGGEQGEYEKNNLQVYGVMKETYFESFGEENCALTDRIEKEWESYKLLALELG